MKKVIALMLALVMLIGSSAFVVSAQENKSSTEDDFYKDELYYDEFVALCRESGCPCFVGSSGYYEEYYHRVDANDPESQIDWVFCQGFGVWYESNYYCYCVVEDRILYMRDGQEPFRLGFFLYDVKKAEFIDLADVKNGEYEGLREFLDERFIHPYHDFVGDANNDGKVNILDATEIQRALAEITEFHPADELFRADFICIGEQLNYVSDFDRDGKRTVMDATGIQMYLAELDVPVATPDQA